MQTTITRPAGAQAHVRSLLNRPLGQPSNEPVTAPQPITERRGPGRPRKDDAGKEYSHTVSQFAEAARRAEERPQSPQPKQEPIVVADTEFEPAEALDFEEEQADFEPPKQTLPARRSRPSDTQPKNANRLQEVNYSTGEITETELAAPKISMSMNTLRRVENTLKKLESMAPGRSLKTAYLKFEKPGEYIRGVFIGFRMISKPGSGGAETLKSICLMAPDGYTYLNAGVDIVEQFDEVNLYDPVQIEFVGYKKTGNANTMKEYSVSVLIEGEEQAEYEVQ